MRFTSVGLPLKVNAVLRAMTKLPDRRERSVVRSSVRPSAKNSPSGSVLRLAKGRTTSDSAAMFGNGGAAIEGLYGRGSDGVDADGRARDSEKRWTGRARFLSVTSPLSSNAMSILSRT